MKFYIISVIISMTLFYSCENKTVNLNEKPEYETACNKGEFKPASLKVNINTTKDTAIKLNNDYSLLIPKGSFGEATQTEFEIVCYTNMADILLNNLTTSAEGKNILCTKGMFEITNQKDSLIQPIYLIGSDKLPDYGIFYGKKENEKTVWVISVGANTPAIDSSKVFTEDYFMVNQFGWVNVDKFYEYEDTTQLMVSVDKHMEEVNFSLVFKNEKTVLPLYAENGKLTIHPIPAGIDVTIVGIGKVGNDYYYQFLDMNTNDKGKSFPELIKVGKDEIKSVLTEKFGTTL